MNSEHKQNQYVVVGRTELSVLENVLGREIDKTEAVGMTSAYLQMGGMLFIELGAAPLAKTQTDRRE